MSKKPYTDRGAVVLQPLLPLAPEEASDRLRGKLRKAAQLASLQGRGRKDDLRFWSELRILVGKYGSERYEKILLTKADRKEIKAIIDTIKTTRRQLKSQRQAVNVAIRRRAENARNEFEEAAIKLEGSLKSALDSPTASEHGAPPLVGMEEPVNALLDLWEEWSGRDATHNRGKAPGVNGEEVYVNPASAFVALLLPAIRPGCTSSQIESTLRKVIQTR